MEDKTSEVITTDREQSQKHQVVDEIVETSTVGVSPSQETASAVVEEAPPAKSEEPALKAPPVTVVSADPDVLISPATVSCVSETTTSLLSEGEGGRNVQECTLPSEKVLSDAVEKVLTREWAATGTATKRAVREGVERLLGYAPESLREMKDLVGKLVDARVVFLRNEAAEEETVVAPQRKRRSTAAAVKETTPPSRKKVKASAAPAQRSKADGSSDEESSSASSTSSNESSSSAVSSSEGSASDGSSDDSSSCDSSSGDERRRPRRGKKGSAASSSRRKSKTVASSSRSTARKGFKATQSGIMTRTTFLNDAKPIEIQLGPHAISLEPREFSTGSCGWFYGAKSQLPVGDKQVMCQITLNCAVVGSKQWKEGNKRSR